MLLMIDNYDSFTFNIVQYLGELGADVRVVRNDEIDVDGIAALDPERLVISPGPCTPKPGRWPSPRTRSRRVWLCPRRHVGLPAGCRSSACAWGIRR